MELARRFALPLPLSLPVPPFTLRSSFLSSPLVSPPVPPAAAAPPAQPGALGAIAGLGLCGWSGRWLNDANEGPRAGPVGSPPRHPRGAVSPVRWASPAAGLASLPAEPGSRSSDPRSCPSASVQHPPLTPGAVPVWPWGRTAAAAGAVPGMFGKNKRPLSDLLNPARRKGGTKGPPARRTKSFIHSLCTCPCLPRSSFWWGDGGGRAPG